MQKAAGTGLATPEQWEGRSGRELLQAMIDGEIPPPPISAPLTFSLVEVGDGFAAFEGEPGEHLLNPAGTVHGGWALTLIDSAAGCAAQTTLPVGGRYTTIETKANFSRPILPDTGTVRAEGTVISRGRQIITTEVKMHDRQGRLLAHGTSTLMVLQAR